MAGNRVAFLLFLACALLFGCTEEKPQKVTEEKELIIFCGITMISPVKELMGVYEKKTGIKSTMSYGGSKDLLNSLMVNKTGDLYFPGSESLFAEADRTGLLKERKVVGINQTALFVHKGNPKGLTGDLDDLLRPGLRIAIGHPDLGSVGREAFEMLTRKGIYDKVVAASAMLLPDSKALSAALREDKLDVVLNWKAAYSTGDNANFMDMLPIPDKDAKRHELTMAVTAYSGYPEAAQQFLELCVSPEGRAIFEKYGF